MAILSYTREEIIERLQRSIQETDSEVDVTYGPVKDIVIDPMSEELRLVNDNIYHVSRIQSLLNVDEMDEIELDNLAYNWLIVRKLGTYATGTIWFQSATSPGFDVEIPLNTVVATGGDENEPVQFVTTEVKVFQSSYKDSYYNAGEDVYELGVPIRAISIGSNGNVAAGNINILSSSVLSFTKVVNKEVTYGGSDKETNAQMAQRLSLALMGIEKASVQGLELWFEENEGIIDASVIDAQDPLMVREEAGAVDVAIIGTDFREAQQITIYNGLEIVFDNQPVKSVVSVIGTNGEYKEGVEWVFVEDTTSVYARSVRAISKLEWRAIDTLPDMGENLTITYQYDKKVIDMQQLIEEDDNRFLADVLVKSADKVNIEMALRIKAYSGFNQSNVRDAVEAALYSFVNTLKLGDDVEQSDLVFEARKVAGVDNVEIPFIQLKIDGEGSGTSDISIRKDQYARVASGKIEVWSS
jgi:uncharacterized phage protein gp47/JayE